MGSRVVKLQPVHGFAAQTTAAGVIYAASGWGMVVVSIAQKYAGHSAQVLALAAQCPAAAYYTKWVIVVDDDVDPRLQRPHVVWCGERRVDDGHRSVPPGDLHDGGQVEETVA